MDPVLRTLLLERLGAATWTPSRARDRAGLDTGAGSAGSAPPVWLRSVTVEGFRGIGPPATLELEPPPGLTVVVGRNGSGKSSFAEGLELLMTGALKRWEKRPKAWTETWQCLHHTGPTRLSAELVLEGSGETVALSQEWPHGAGYGDSSGRAAPAGVLAAHGWDRDLPSFRPFLSYAELATMFDTLSSLYDALAPVLGLADVDELAKRLGEARLAYDNQRKAVAAQQGALLARLDPEDERAALVAGVLGAKQARPRRAGRAAARRAGVRRGDGAAAAAGRARRAGRRRDRGGVRGAAGGRARARRRRGDGREARDRRRRAAAPRARGPRRRGLPGVRHAGRARRRVGGRTRRSRPPRWSSRPPR